MLLVACGHKDQSISKMDANPEIYLAHSNITDPKNNLYLYENLPLEYKQICNLIKKQQIHPIEAANYRDVIPDDRQFEDTIYLSVNSMLNGLLKFDSTGLYPNRRPQDRLLVGCVHHSLLLASILRENNIPVRIRFGFAPYIGKQFGIDVNIDPDRNLVDIPSRDFITGAEAWIALRNNEIDIKKFRSAFFKKEQSILDMLRLDLSYALLDEKMYWGDTGVPEIPTYEELSSYEYIILDSISILLNNAGSN